MKRFFRKPDSVGHPPGTLVPTDKTEQQPLKLTLFNYGPQMLVEESQVQRVSDVFPIDSIKDVIWLNVGGSLQVETLEEIGGYLDIHPLVLEDILDTSQRPKMEDFDRYLIIELNMLLWEQDYSQIKAEQVSMILGDHFVVTFQESKKDVFDPVRKRLREADYLAHSFDRRHCGSSFSSFWKTWESKSNSWKKNWSPIRIPERCNPSTSLSVS